VTLSPKGRILCFDPWRERRHVLTGPLLTHWGAQVGLAPLDVTVGHLARWLCCVAKVKPLAPEAGEDAGEDAMELLRLGAIGLVQGRAFESLDSIQGAGVRRVDDVGVWSLLGRLLGMLSDHPDTTLATASALDVLQAPGVGVALLRAQQNRFSSPLGSLSERGTLEREKIAALTRVKQDALPASAREATADIVYALAEAVPLRLLKSSQEPALAEPLLKALGEAGLETLADLTLAGPQRAARAVRPLLAGPGVFAEARVLEKAVVQVYDAAVAALAGAGEAVVAIAATHDARAPFLRADLTNPNTVATLRKVTNDHLREHGLSPEAMAAVLARAAAAPA
jgi:hypothetical protein